MRQRRLVGGRLVVRLRRGATAVLTGGRRTAAILARRRSMMATTILATRGRAVGAIGRRTGRGRVALGDRVSTLSAGAAAEKEGIMKDNDLPPP